MLTFDRFIRGAAILAVLSMLVIGVRLNQHEAVQSAIDTVKSESYTRETADWAEKVAGCAFNNRQRIVEATANIGSWEAARARARAQRDDTGASDMVRKTSGDAAETYTQTITDLGAVVREARDRDCEAAYRKPPPPTP